MSTVVVSKLYPTPEAKDFEQLLKDIVSTVNHRHQALLNQYKVGEIEVSIIRYLTDEEDQKKMKEVGEHFGIKLSTLTSTIDKLEKGKLVKRKNSKDDRRVIFIQPTPKGKKAILEIDSVTREVSEQLAQETNAQEFEHLMKGLEKALGYLKA